MSDNQIGSVINLLTSEKGTAEQLASLVRSLKDKETPEHEKLPSQPNEQIDKLQLKINLINAIIPLLSEKATEQAQFLIKILTIISVINKLKNE